MRRLEIGPGHERLPGFETLNAERTIFTDHVGSAQRPPFPDETFDEVYSSHCIEHVEWYEVESTIKEWVRILKPSGLLEVHTVNGAGLMRKALEWEEGLPGSNPGRWRVDLHRNHPFLWATGRILSYRQKGSDLNLHRAIITPRYLAECFAGAGLVGLVSVDEPRGRKKHSTINMGLRGFKR